MLPKTATQLNDLLPKGTIDPVLWDGERDFRVVYDQATGHVKEVFYAEKDIDSALDTLSGKSRAERVNLFRGRRTLVGYYGSDVAALIVTKPLPTPGVEVLIENGEELTLTVTYTLPKEGLPADVVCTPDVKLDYQGTTANPPLLSVDETTNVVKSPYEARLTDATKDSDVTTAKAGDTVVYTWVLDSLESEKDPTSGERSFPKQFRGLILGSPGGNFTVTAKLKLTAPGCIESAYYAQDTDNSLFAEKTGNGTTAYIANVRHLQNLHRDHSGAASSIVKAEQLCDVDCKGGAYNFIPIANGALNSYNGRQKAISGLYVECIGDAGLFGLVTNDNSVFEGIRLLSPRIISTGAAAAGGESNAAPLLARVDENACTLRDIEVINGSAKGATYAGGLVGVVNQHASCRLEDCRVYWNTPEELVKGSASKQVNYVISGNCAGGLIGLASGTTVATESFAATTVDGGTSTGGLAGRANSLTVSGSYADCYLAGSGMTGGLVGQSQAALNLTNCYAAGFIMEPDDGQNTAGLVSGTVGTAENCYSVVRVIKKGADGKLETPATPATPMYSGWNESSPGSAFYLSKADEVTPNLFGGAFEYTAADDSPETHIYNLRYKLSGKAEDALKPPYPYPGLKGTDGAAMPHYGDWAKLEGSSGAGLVYYETYGDDSCGVWGADADGKKLQNLKNDTDNPVVTKDGYALLFERPVPDDYTIEIEYGNVTGSIQTWTLNSGMWSATDKVDQTAETFPVGVGGKTYTLVPLPSEIVLKAWNKIQNDSNFYRKLVCGEGANARTYWFNPHFAKTVHTEQPEEPTPSKEDAIIVRTPRHFWNLGAIEYKQDYYNSNQVYVSNKEYYFQQELDLNFATYDVASAGINVTKGYKAIGSNTNNTFSGTYDGQEHAIKNLRREHYKSIAAIGLFGYSSGTLKNIVYHMDQFDCSVMGTNWGCAGGLATHSTGAVENCTVIIQTGELIGEGGGGSAGVLGAGGLVGYNGGSIVDSRVISSENPPEGSGWAVDLETVQKSGSSSAYVGGLVGFNNGTISFSDPTRYSATIGTLGAANETRLGGVAGRNDQNGTLEKWTVSITDMSSNSYAGGLVASNVGGTIKDCKTTVTNLTCNGYWGDVGGLAGHSSGSILECKATVTALTNKVAGSKVGGLVGENTVEGTIKGCQATITDLKNTASVNSGSITNLGGLAGYSAGSITNCTATVTDLTNQCVNTYVGGLVGYSRGTGPIENCTAKVETLTNRKDSCRVGGLVGGVENDITNCTATVTNLTSTNTRSYVGGLAGYSTGNVTDCTAEVTEKLYSSGLSNYAGGLVGWSEKDVTNCRAKVGLLKSGGGGYPTNSGHIPNCIKGDACYAGGLVGQSRGTVTA